MSYLQATVYGLIQGLTEFLPISSSAHLALAPRVLGWSDPGLTFDVALHVGTLAATIAYFWRDWRSLAAGGLRDPRGPEGRRLLMIAAATLPAVLSGLLLEEKAETVFRDTRRIAGALIVFGVLLDRADRLGAKNVALSGLDWRRALGVGAAQALAIVPGVSRSGVTMTAGLALGLNPEAAARFSFLLALPITAGAAVFKLRGLALADLSGPFLWGILVSGAAGAAAIHFFLTRLRTATLRPYAVYRVLVGLALFALAD